MDNTDYSASLSFIGVSILVLVERPFGQFLLVLSPRAHHVSILVLVERPFGLWRPPQHNHDRLSFNPCFGGEAIWTARAEAHPMRHSMFQSLFWWRGHLDFAKICDAVMNCKFQSLFWWRGHLDWPPSLPGLPTLWVSILVLVERPFGRRCRVLSPHQNDRFQSLFWWRGHLDPVPAVVAALPWVVSILVLVERPFGRGAGKL